MRNFLAVWLAVMGLVYLPGYLTICAAELEVINPFDSSIGRALFVCAALFCAIAALLSGDIKALSRDGEVG